PPPARIRTVAVEREDDDAGELRRARTVVAVGVGVEPGGYPVIDELRAALGGAALGATRRVTDRGWAPRGRQIGVTGHAVAPRLLLAVGSSGRFNHTVGIRNAGVLMAVNSDPEAEIFDQVDVGLVGEWQTIVPALTAELNSRGAAERMGVDEPAATSPARTGA
ncbi:MAG: electron transfer flavoprotein subunit alpha/FixB family protein, partial [Acidimicrobiaceae bacterium]|nr:electron transfer flavoprotein subunit alpha/FixB family protein [Acidimicrobiaceae bacterium]